MAIAISEEAKQAIRDGKSLLQKNDLKGFFSKLRDQSIRKEVINFLLSIEFDIFKYLDSIPSGFCSDMDGFDSITIPGNIEKIGDNAFNNSSVNSVTLEDGVDFIGSKAFANTPITSVDLGSVKVIKDGAFSGCNNLKVIYLPESVSMLGRNVFPDNVILKSPPRKRRSLRFPKSELAWYREHLMVDRDKFPADTEEE